MFLENIRRKQYHSRTPHTCCRICNSLSSAIPEAKLIKDCDFKSTDKVDSYIKRLCKIWLKKSECSPVEAGEYLRTMTVMRDLLTVLEHHVKTIDQLQKIG